MLHLPDSLAVEPAYIGHPAPQDDDIRIQNIDDHGHGLTEAVVIFVHHGAGARIAIVGLRYDFGTAGPAAAASALPYAH